MPLRSDPSINDPETTAPPSESADELLTLFNFHWLKFLSKKRVIDQRRKLIESRIAALENQGKIDSMRSTITDLSST